MRRLAPHGISEDVLHSLWMKQMPISVRCVLCASEGVELTKPAYIARDNSSYEQQSSQPPRTYPGKKKNISFAADLRGDVIGEGVLVGAPTILPAPAAQQKRHVSSCTSGTAKKHALLQREVYARTLLWPPHAYLASDLCTS
jgi:hypothetical protein